MVVGADGKCGIADSWAARIYFALFLAIRRGLFGMTTPDGTTTASGSHPADIAQSLLREFGPANAYLEAAREGYQAQTEGRFYELSVWREVKAILREGR